MSSDQSPEEVVAGKCDLPDATAPIEVNLEPGLSAEASLDYQKLYQEELLRIARGHVPNRHDRRAARSITKRKIYGVIRNAPK